MCSNRAKKKKLLSQSFLLALLALGVAAWFFINPGIRHRGGLVCVFERADGSKTAPFFLESATTDGERQRGLMYRKPGEMAADEGMIFVFPEERQQTFWMRNTYIPLDMLFLSEGLEVRGVLSNVPTLNDDPRSAGGKSKFVVELLAGRAELNSISPGAKLVCAAPIPRAG